MVWVWAWCKRVKSARGVNSGLVGLGDRLGNELATYVAVTWLAITLKYRD